MIDAAVAAGVSQAGMWDVQPVRTQYRGGDFQGGDAERIDRPMPMAFDAERHLDYRSAAAAVDEYPKIDRVPRRKPHSAQVPAIGCVFSGQWCRYMREVRKE